MIDTRDLSSAWTDPLPMVAWSYTGVRRNGPILCPSGESIVLTPTGPRRRPTVLVVSEPSGDSPCPVGRLET